MKADIQSECEDIFFTMGGAVPAGATCAFTAQSYLPMKPRTLIYEGPRDTFVITDIQIGKNSQLASYSDEGVPAETFAMPLASQAQEISDRLVFIQNRLLRAEQLFPAVETAWLAESIDAVLSHMGANLGRTERLLLSMNFTVRIRNLTQIEQTFRCLVKGPEICR